MNVALVLDRCLTLDDSRVDLPNAVLAKATTGKRYVMMAIACNIL